MKGNVEWRKKSYHYEVKKGKERMWLMNSRKRKLEIPSGSGYDLVVVVRLCLYKVNPNTGNGRT